MSELLSLIVGCGLGMFLQYYLCRLFLLRKYKGWTIRTWRGAENYMIWAKNEDKDAVMACGPDGEITINYVSESKE